MAVRVALDRIELEVLVKALAVTDRRRFNFSNDERNRFELLKARLQLALIKERQKVSE